MVTTSHGPPSRVLVLGLGLGFRVGGAFNISLTKGPVTVDSGVLLAVSYTPENRP